MRITSVHIANFKRFSDLQINRIADNAKLVLLIGSNGCGKSSIFDAFDFLGKGVVASSAYDGIPEYETYYNKNSELKPTVIVKFDDGNFIKKEGFFNLETSKGAELFAKNFIGRSSIRIVPKIGNTANLNAISSNNDKPISFIENDQRFLNDVYAYIQEINNAIREPIFQGRQADVLKIFHDFISPFNIALINIFGGTEKTTIQITEFQDAKPNTNPKLIFKKGESKINYDLLSHGEKQVVILLLNFIVRREFYNNAIIFIDEMDCHLNTSLQENLLHEIVTNWIPETSQLWTATHALGFINYAYNSEIAAILDFDLLNFDRPQIIVPAAKHQSDVFEIAVSKLHLATLFKNIQFYCIENTDIDYYINLNIDGVLFVKETNRNSIYSKTLNSDFKGIVDRDFLSDSDIKELMLNNKNLRILNYYSIENYLYHPENINEFANSNKILFNKAEYISEIVRVKNQYISKIILEIKSVRMSYNYFKEPKLNNKSLSNRFSNTEENSIQTAEISSELKNDDFEIFYKHFSMKNYKSEFLFLQNIPIENLSKTNWFKTKLKERINLI